MNLQMGNQRFENVEIPLLWGTRAILQDSECRISIISLEGAIAVIEILGNKPAPNIEYEPTTDGFKIIVNGQELYSYNPERHIITALSLGLPECEIKDTGIRVGNSMFSGNRVVGFGVVIAVNERGVAMGTSLPKGLAKLVI